MSVTGVRPAGGTNLAGSWGAGASPGSGGPRPQPPPAGRPGDGGFCGASWGDVPHGVSLSAVTGAAPPRPRELVFLLQPLFPWAAGSMHGRQLAL